MDKSKPIGRAVLVVAAALVVGLSAYAAKLIQGRGDSKDQVAAASTSAEPLPIAKRGKLLYQLQCARCHGAEGHGDGPDSVGLNPGPRDFAAGGWRFGPTPEAIRKVIVEGIPGTSMYPMGGTFSTRELISLVGHVRSLATSGLEPILRSAGFEPATPIGPAPGFQAEDLEGRPRSFAFEPAGKPTLLVFWGTSCAPCQEELPELERLAIEFGPRGLDLTLVCVDEADRGRVARSIQGKFDRFPSFVSVDGMARLRYDIQTLPVAALIDGEGRLLGTARGRIDWKAEPARRLIGRLLELGD